MADYYGEIDSHLKQRVCYIGKIIGTIVTKRYKLIVIKHFFLFYTNTIAL